MPIPYLSREPELSREPFAEPFARPELVSSSSFSAAPARRPARARLLYPARAVAHLMDMALLIGCSLYVAKLFTLVVVALHLNSIRGTGRLAGGLFREAFVAGQGQFFAATFVVFSLLYFVMMPMRTGKTFGLGIVGLCLRGEDGAHPTLKPLVSRYGWCVMAYLSGGLLILAGLRSREGRLLQDHMSRTHVAVSED